MLKNKVLVSMLLILIAVPLVVHADTTSVSERFTRYYDKLPVGENTVFVDVEDISLVRITLMNDVIAYNVRVYLSTFSYNPAALPLIDNVYQYHNLLVTNIDSSRLSDASVEYRITKEWIAENNADEESIGFYHLVDGQWVSLSVEKIATDAGYVYYKSPISTFGYFVITAAQKDDVPVVVTQEPEVVEEVVEEVEEVEEPEVKETVVPEETSETLVLTDEKSFGFIVFILVGVLVLGVGAGGYFYYRSRGGDTTERDYFVKEVSPDKYLHLENQVVVKDMYDLADALKKMTAKNFALHVQDQKNDFSSWVETAVADPDCAMKMKIAVSQTAMYHVVTERINELEHRQTLHFLTKKYSLNNNDVERLLNSVVQSAQQNVPPRQIFEDLIAHNYERSLAYDVVFGLNDSVEDVIMHPEDEALIDRLIYDAAKKKEDFLSIKIDLLEAGWPRFVVEKKMDQHFNTSH